MPEEYAAVASERLAADFRFQVASDLHLEAPRGLWSGQQRQNDYDTFDLPQAAPSLALLGDIGLVAHEACLQFVRRKAQAARFEKVFWLLGNHEFYDSTVPETVAKAKALERELNGRLVLLHKTRYDVPHSKLTILACTLWSQVLPDQLASVEKSLSDFKRIRGFTTRDFATRHREELAWLEAEVAKAHAEARRIVIFTHHPPIVLPQHRSLPNYSAFSTDLLSMPNRFPSVILWAFGHTHQNVDQQVGGVHVVSNQRGYDHDFLGDFQADFVLEL